MGKRTEDQPEWFECPTDPNPGSFREDDGVATLDELGNLHGDTAYELSRMVQHGNIRTKLSAVSLSIKFLKDNNITASLKGDTKSPTNELLKSLPTVEELERIMSNSPD